MQSPHNLYPKHQLSMHEIASKGYAQVARDQLVFDPGSVNSKDEQGCTPLHYAAGKGHVKTLRALCHPKERIFHVDADLEAKDPNGRTPLHYAARFGHPKAIKSLILAGADKEATDRFGRTPAETGKQFGQTKAVKALEEPVEVEKKGVLRRFFSCLG